MLFLPTNKKLNSKSISKILSASSAASVLSVCLLAAPAAHAQTNVFNTRNLPEVNITDCANLVDSPGENNTGLFITIDTGVNCVVSNGDHIDLGSGPEGQDNVVINVEAGTTLTNTDGSASDTVFFVDNGENNVDFLIQDGATLSGTNGVIYIEGDSSLIVNLGDIIGTGAAEEGVIYFDRDTDGALNTVVNQSTGSILATASGPAIGIEVLLADGSDDAEDVGVQDAISDFPTVRIVNRGLIETTGVSSDDNDAINIAGAEGTTGGLARVCLEGSATNCNVTLRLTNTGTIRSVFDSSSNAAIAIEDDAIFHGQIRNLAGGLITGTRNGIRIGDVADEALTAEHTGGIRNLGDITGTGASSRGIDLEGDGISILNAASGTISGVSVGIEVGAGSSGGINHSGLNNIISNSGNITGGNYSIDSNSAEGDLRIISTGGSFNGDIRGSAANVDQLVIRGAAATNLTHDVLQNFDVRVERTGTLNLVGDRTIEGRLLSVGTVGFDLSDTHTVTGDVFLASFSTVEISDASAVANVGDEFTLIEVGGLLRNGSTLDASQAISDSSFLLDFEYVDSTDLVVAAVAAGAGTPSSKVSGFVSKIDFSNASAQTFGDSVLTAFVGGDLNNSQAFSNLANLGTADDVGNALASLAPDYSGSLVQDVFNTVQGSTAQIDQRLNDLDCNAFYDGRETASFGSEGNQACQSFAQNGAWIQTSRPQGTDGSLSLSAPSFFNAGSGQDSLTMTYGYDHVLDETTVVGFSGSYTETEIDEDSRTVASTDTDLEIVQFNAYAGHRVGNAHFVTKASYAYGEADTNRQSFEAIKSQIDINSLNVESVASYNVDIGKGLYLKPEAGLHYSNVSTSAFTETGGLNLNVSEASTNVLDASVGLTLGARKVISDNTKADVYFTGALRNDFYGDRDDLGFDFAGQSGSLAVTTLNEFAVQGLAGVNILSGKNFSFGGAVNGEFSGNENAVGGSVQTKIRW